MKTIRFSGTTANYSTPIDLGRQGENLARIIDIDISAWRAEFGEGTVQLLHQRPGDSAPYPAAVEQTGDVVRWAITAADTARVGYGAAQLLFYAGDVLAKQCIYRTYVSPSLGQSAGEPPEAQQPWVERVLAEAAKVTGMTARAVELPAGADPTADYADGVLVIGIPPGPKGDKGDPGAQGEIGPQGPQGEKGDTGAKGDPGAVYTPSVSSEGVLSWSNNGGLSNPESVSIRGPKGDTGATGAQGPAGEIGPQGPQGEKGDTGAQGPQGETGPAGADGKSAYQYAQDGGYTGTQEEFAAKLAEEMPTALPNPNALTFTGAVTGSYDGSAPLEVEIPSGGGAAGDYIPAPATAEVGQTVVVKAVDESGKPTEWEVKNTITRVAKITTEENCASLEVTGLNIKSGAVSVRLYNTGGSCGSGLHLAVNNQIIENNTGSSGGDSTEKSAIRLWLYKVNGMWEGRAIMANNAINIYKFSHGEPIEKLMFKNLYNDGETKYYKA